LPEWTHAVFPKLTERRHQRAGTISGEYRQMLAISRALMSDPKPLMPDEPGLGLATAVIDAVYETLGRPLREGLTIPVAKLAVEMALEEAHHAYARQVSRSAFFRFGAPNRMGSGGAANLPRGQRRGRVAKADYRAESVPETGSISKLILT
jgi:ABC-type histidine transport system ATPase subunit